VARLQELTHQQMNEAIAAATERQVPVTVTVRTGKNWINLQSKLLAPRGEHMLLAAPKMREGEVPPEIRPAEKLGLSFKLKHHKHILAVTAVGTDTVDGLEGGPEVLEVCWPTRMHRLQRRAYLRAEVPAGRIVRVSFWLGGREDEPVGGAMDRPVWSGRVTNISAGGFQAVAKPDQVWDLDIGETVGVRLAFEAGSESVYADAQLRHLDETEGRILMGFQFLGLAQDRKGREVLQLVSAKVAEYQHSRNS